MSPEDIQAAFMFIVWFVLGGGFSVALVAGGLHVGYCYLLDRHTQKNLYGVQFGPADLALSIVMVLGGIALMAAVLQAVGVYSEVLGG